MEIGIGTITYELAGVPLKASVDRIAAFGIKYLDILAAGIYNPSLLPERDQNEIGEKMFALGMRASSIVTCAEGNLASSDRDEAAGALEQLKLAALLVKRLGGKQVLVGKGAGNIDFDLPRDVAYKNAVNVLCEYCDWCLKRDVIVTLELEPEALHVCNGVDAMRALIDDVGAPNIAANLDLGHLNILRTPPSALSLVKEKIIHVHISDNYGLAHNNAVIGDGNTKFKAYIEEIERLGIEENARAFGDVAVAAIEVGEPAESIYDPDIRVTKSYGYVLANIPSLRKARTM